jgi:TPR repeat protein
MAVEQSKFTVSNSISNWNPQGSYVERLMDNAAYTSAHPDDTLVLVGPSRFANIAGADVTTGAVADISNVLFPVGMLQSLVVSQSRNVVPTTAIGSGRAFMMAGKSTTQLQIGRLFAKGRNLQRALMRGIKEIGDGDISEKFNIYEPANPKGNPGAMYNMDSEAMLIPFGMAVMFRDKAGNDLGSFYIESCMINSYSVQLAAGQNVIMENVSAVCDRILPVTLSGGVVGKFFNPNGVDVLSADSSLNVNSEIT